MWALEPSRCPIAGFSPIAPEAEDYFANTNGPVEVSGSSIVAPASTKFDPSALPEIEACL